jgi:hypothetical protein
VKFNQVPLQFLASMLGMTPETFSRIRKKWFPDFCQEQTCGLFHMFALTKKAS